MSSNPLPASSAPVKSTGLHTGEIAPGVAKVDPIIVADNVTRTFGGLTAVSVDHLEIPRNAITALIGSRSAIVSRHSGVTVADSSSWGTYPTR